MQTRETIYVLGAGAIGFPLAAYLRHAGRQVVAVRTRSNDAPPGVATIAVDAGATRIEVAVETVALSQLTGLDGTVVIAAKAYANDAIAWQLATKAAAGPIVVMQNGIGIERAFLERSRAPVYRCILYATSQATSAHEFMFRPVASSPIGIVRGDEDGLTRCIEQLSTDAFTFHAEADIQREIWKKAIANAAFNSICPLLEIDNGVFARDAETLALARDLVGECLTVANRLGMTLDERELLEKIIQISRRSDGQAISTWQDIRSGRRTEIESLNLEIARIAAELQPPISLPRVELLGKMIQAKSRCHGAG